MMKKIILFAILCIFTLFSCTRKEDIDNEIRPDKKLNATLAEYKDILTAAPNGWVGYLYPSGGGGFTFKFNFNKDETVSMYAILSEEYATTAKTSLFSLRAPQIPSLYFDTYNYLHELADPKITKYGGTYSVGAGGDFEFGIVDVGPDTIKLRGNFRKSDLILIKAKANQGDDFITKAYDFVQNKLGKIERFPYYYKKLSVNGEDYAITINTDKSTVSIWNTKEGKTSSFYTEYAVSDNGIMLRKAFIDGDFVLQSLSDIEVDIVASKAALKVNNTINAEITNVAEPIAISAEGPIQLYGNYSKTYTSYGFNYDGVKDYFKLQEEPSLQGAYFKQRYYIDNYDVMYYDYLNANNVSTRYISVMRGNINTPNVIKYSVNNYNGTSPGGTLATKIANIRSWFGDSEGYYVYPTGNGFYDLVSVADGKKWIRLY